MTHRWELALNVGERALIPTEQGGVSFDSCSIQSKIEGTGWSTGVVAVQITNDPDMAPVALTTPVNISSDTLTHLTGSDWQKAQYLVLACTTGASGILARFAVTLKRLNP